MRTVLLVLLAATLASCSSNSDNPVVPNDGNDDHPAPVRMITVVGTPRVKVNFDGQLSENPNTGLLGGQSSVFFRDSIGVRIFLNEVRLGGVLMHEERGSLGEPSRYTLDGAELTGYAIGDTLRFEVVDGGTITPPFSYVIIPSHFKLPADSSVIHKNVDLTLPFTGIVESVLAAITDQPGRRLLYNLRVENYSGQTSIFIRGSDLAVLVDGPITLGTTLLDTETFVANDYYLQDVSIRTTQNRHLTLDP